MGSADSTDVKVADAPAGNWVDTHLPAAAKPYARLARWDRPIGWWLLMWPCWWSTALAATSLGTPPNPISLALFTLGAILMRGAGCTYNDILDKDFDAAVERTKSRPIPSGQVSTEAALLFMMAQAFLALIVVLQFNTFTVLTAFGSLIIVALYPLAKRVTDWPQVVLGFAFSWGALVGWASVIGSLSLAPILLYAAAVAWTVGYDTIYAHQDQRDDAIVGVRSTARLFGRRSKAAISLAYGLTVVLVAAALAAMGAGVASYLGLAAFAAHLVFQITRVATEDPASCLNAFRSNRWAGALLFIGLAADGTLRWVI
ncbi:MAG: 4-hydroxybenzoate octaprenyltransferase [Pseudomonadota bacterium]